MRGWCVALVALIGCDKLFDVDHVSAPLADAAVDAPPIFLDAPEPCPGSYAVFPDAPDTSVYLWVPLNSRWEVAEGDCESDSRTKITHLVVFDEPGEMAAVRKQLNMMFGQFASHAGYARDVSADPFEFFAVTGEALPISGPPWNPNEPTGVVGAGEETTVRFESFADLTDQPYTQGLSYLCECDHRKATRTFMLSR